MILCLPERPSPPLNFDVFNYDAKATTSLLLIWNEPLIHNGKIDYYTVSPERILS